MIYRLLSIGPLGRMPYDDLKGGFLSDSLRESPQKIGIADRLEAGSGNRVVLTSMPFT